MDKARCKLVGPIETSRTYYVGLLFDVLIIALVWCTSILIVNPVGEFPLIDDSIYKAAVTHFVDTGDYRPIISTPSLITNVLWGSLFVLLGGTGYTTLRISTLFGSFLGLVGIYVLVRDLQKSRSMALVSALTVGFSPAYYPLSYTFMTDVLFTTIAVWAAICFFRALKSGSHAHVIVGTLLALAATLSRQIGLSVPVAFTVILLLKEPISPRTILRAAAPSVVCVGGLFIFNNWLEESGRSPALYYISNHELIEKLANGSLLPGILWEHMYAVSLQLGLFLLPILLCTIGPLLRVRGKRGIVQVAIAGAVVAGVVGIRSYYQEAVLMPLPNTSNLLVKSGIGLLRLSDAVVLHLNHMPSIPEPFWLGVTIMGLLGAVFMFSELSTYALYVTPRSLKRLVYDIDSGGAFLMLSGLMCLAPFLILLPTDRYLTPSIPFFVGSIVALARTFPEQRSKLPGLSRISASMVLATFAVFAICGTHDYLAWNRVTWQALSETMENNHVGAKDIDGGIDFNAVYRNGIERDVTDQMAALRDEDARFCASLSNRELNEFEFYFRLAMSASSARYMVTYGPVPGYILIKKYTYSHWLPLHTQEILVLQKK